MDTLGENQWKSLDFWNKDVATKSSHAPDFQYLLMYGYQIDASKSTDLDDMLVKSIGLL